MGLRQLRSCYYLPHGPFMDRTARCYCTDEYVDFLYLCV